MSGYQQFADIDWIGRAKALNPRVCNFVGGRRQAEGAGAWLEKFSPRDGSMLYRVKDSEASEVDAAVMVARGAADDGRWSRLPLQHRKDALFKLATLIDLHRDELAVLECLDVGKPIHDAWNADIPGAAKTLRFCAEATDKLYGQVYAVEQTNLSYELRRPVGVVAAVIGWNFPLCLAVQKIAPVLATGNSLILKPSELTSLSASRVAELALEAGVPEGVFNVIHGGANVGRLLAQHNAVDLLTFTGSSQTGKALQIAAGQSNMKRLLLECGGKAPNIVFDDCPDLDGIADAVINAAFWNQGQVCVASSRLLLHEGIQEELIGKLVLKATSITLGDPLRAETRYGAVVSEGHVQKVMSYIAMGEREGAQAICQPTMRPFPGGYYVAPTILKGVATHHRIAQEEIFGPVLSVITFRDEQEAIKIANDTIYGLSAVVWTRDVGRGHRVSQALDAGWVVVNATDKPSGGPSEGILSIGGHKQSGIGTEGGVEGLRAYTSHTAVQWFI